MEVNDMTLSMSTSYVSNSAASPSFTAALLSFFWMITPYTKQYLSFDYEFSTFASINSELDKDNFWVRSAFSLEKENQLKNTVCLILKLSKWKEKQAMFQKHICPHGAKFRFIFSVEAKP